MKYVMLFFVLSVSVLAQVSAVPDSYGLRLGQKTLELSLSVLPPSPFEFRGIRIGDEMKEAERKFLAWRMPSLYSRSGLCGSDGIARMESCTNVLDTGEYVSLTMLDGKVAKIYISTDNRGVGNTYNSYVFAMTDKYGSPDSLEARQGHYRHGTALLKEYLRWSKDDQYMEAREVLHSITIGSESLDAKMAGADEHQIGLLSRK